MSAKEMFSAARVHGLVLGSIKVRSDFRRLEDRVLMSASPLDFIGRGDVDGGGDSDGLYLIAPLSSGSDGQPLLTTPFELLITGEDGNSSEIDLGVHFHDVETPDSQLQFQVIDVSESSIFADLSIDGQQLTLDYAANAFGEAQVVIRAIDGSGNHVDGQLNVAVLPVNDRPTTSGFSDLSVAAGTGATVLDLFGSFSDVEDADNQLTYTVERNSNAELFSSIEIDQASGTLTLSYAPGQTGTAELTIRATDTDGLFVEMSTEGREFEIYRNTFGTPGVHYPGNVPFAETTLLTSWWYGQDDSQIDEVFFRNALTTFLSGDSDQPIVLNLEHENFAANSPEARDNLALALDILADERPDLTRVGLYRLLPEREFWPTFLLNAAEDRLEKGVGVAGQLQYVETWQAVVNEWSERNSLYRTELVSNGSGTVADKVDVVYPSLYTTYANSQTTNDRGVLTEITIDAATDTLFLHSNVVANGQTIRLNVEDVGRMPDEFARQTDYYVVNASFDSFQLALTLDGPAIDISDTFIGQQFAILTSDYIGHDDYVSSWVNGYARPNLEEAGAFGKETIVYLSPSFDGVGIDYLDKNFFRSQLDAAFELADGTVLFNLVDNDATMAAAADPSNQGWWEALDEFVDYINAPTQFSVTVEPVNGADFFTVSEDGTLSISGDTLLLNDGLGNGVFDVVAVDGPSSAAVFDMQLDGSFTYTPLADFSGTDSFSYAVWGPQGLLSTAEVLISVSAVNDAPVAVGVLPSLFSVSQGAQWFDLNDIFADVDALPGELAFEIIDTSPANILPGIQLAGSNGDHLEIDAGNSVVGTTAVTLAAMDQAGATGFYEIELQIARIFAPISGVADDMTFQHLNPQTLRELGQGAELRGQEPNRWRPMIEQKELSRWFFSSQEDDDESEFPAEFNANALKKTQVPLTRSQGI